MGQSLRRLKISVVTDCWKDTKTLHPIFEERLAQETGRMFKVEQVEQLPYRPKPQSRAQRFSDAVASIQDGASVVGEIKDELENWKGNMEGTALENTQKYSDLDEAISSLESGQSEVESAAGELEGIEIPVAFG